MSATWLVVSVREYYGPCKEVSYLSGPMSEAEARRLAEGHDPDYDATVNARRLAHNQAAAEYAIALKPLVGPYNPSVYCDWSSLPDDVYDAAVASLADSDGSVGDDDVLDTIFNERSIFEVYDKDTVNYYLVQLPK